MTNFRPTQKDKQLVEAFCDEHLKAEVSRVYSAGSRIILNRRERHDRGSVEDPPAISFQRTGTSSYRLELIQVPSDPRKSNRVLAPIGRASSLGLLLADLVRMYLPGEVVVESVYDPCFDDSDELEMQDQAERRKQAGEPGKPFGPHNLDRLVPALQRRHVAEHLLGSPLVFQRRIGTAELCIPKGALVTPGLALLMNEGCPPGYEIDSGDLDWRGTRPPDYKILARAIQLLKIDSVPRDDRWDLPDRLSGATLSWLELYDLRVSLNAILTNSSMGEAFPVNAQPRWVTGPLPGVTARVERPRKMTDIGWFRAIAASVGLKTPSDTAKVAGLAKADYELNGPPRSYDFSATGSIPRGALDYLSSKTDSQRYWDDRRRGRLR